MLQSDIAVASFWISNPLNDVRYNRAAGSDFYGFYYDTSSSAARSSGVCPQGLPVGESNNNVAHSNGKAGFRIENLVSRANPCSDVVVPSEITQNTFSNYFLWKNK